MPDSAALLVPFAALTPVAVVSCALWFERWRRDRTEEPPQREPLLRPPGHSLAIKLDDTLDTILFQLFWAGGLCGLAGAFFAMATAVFAAQTPRWWMAVPAILGLACAAVGIARSVRVNRLVNESRNIRLGLRGEQAVAEALHQAKDSESRVFHDFPGGDLHAKEKWNIDHVLVGPQGVFAIETKARRRRPGRGNQPSHKVFFERDRLCFPWGDDVESIPQAQRNAKWMGEYLSRKTGESVRVEAWLVLPGWYIESKQPPIAGLMILNPRGFEKILPKLPVKLTPPQVRRIATALDERCRDVEF